MKSSLSANENFYFGYFKIQYPNRPLDYKDYGYKESNFLKRVSSHAVADKAYARWVTWRYILLTKYFSS
jgi:hypothetical protein